jgi:(R,R)-butanediol dehydrogenase/meso-butanediol dehydrogenase/diacetyl reductase
MRAVRWHARNDVRLDDVAEPAPPGEDEILVEVEWCGICGTDLEEYKDGPVVIPTSPHPLTGAMAPMILGHEVAGRVTAKGTGADLPIDSLVALDGFLYCSECDFCRRNEVNRCVRWAHIGLSAPGGLAERLVVPARMAIAPEADIAADHLALAEPFAVAVRAVRRAHLASHHRALVIGGGAIGIAVLQVMRAFGCRETVVIEPSPIRRDLARALGADGVAPSIEALIEGDLAQSFDVAVDCSGAVEVPDNALQLLRSGGRLVLVGIAPDAGKLDFKSVILRELTIVGTVGHIYNEDTRQAVSLLSNKRVDPAPMITHRLPLERAISEGFQRLEGSSGEPSLKILVSPRLMK